MSDNQQNITNEEVNQGAAPIAAQPASQVTPAPAAAALQKGGLQGDNVEQLLRDLNKINKKELFWKRLSGLSLVGIFLAVVVLGAIFVPKVTATMDSINSVVAQANSTIEDIDAMVAEMTQASESLNKLVDDNAQTLTEAVTNLSKIDFDGLNQAIQDLQDTVGPMANFMKQFR